MSTKSVPNEAGGKKRGQARANPADCQHPTGARYNRLLARDVDDLLGRVEGSLLELVEGLTAEGEGYQPAEDLLEALGRLVTARRNLDTLTDHLDTELGTVRP
ncbi:MAG: hypothetical protein HS104_06825 [Polyangiaceae bacterium]|nr:hypothetical protein [Polyangiaceae bacterium]